MIKQSGVHPPDSPNVDTFDYQKAAFEVLKLIDAMVINRLKDKEQERCSAYVFIDEDFVPTFTVQGTWNKEHWKSFMHSLLFYCQMTKGRDFLYELLGSYNAAAKEKLEKLFGKKMEE